MGRDKGIFVMRADGTDVRQISEAGGGGLSWSPDGSKLAYSNNDVFVMNVDGTSRIDLTNDPAQEIEPVWAPDGTKILFRGRGVACKGCPDPPWDIYTINPDGSGLTRLTDDGNWKQQLGWSPDGSKIVFSGIEQPALTESASGIWVMDADGSDQHRIGSVIGFVPAWGPDLRSG
jgi:Tol biopolymer transport system component